MFKYIIVLVVFFSSCQNVIQETPNNIIVFSKFPDTEKVTFKNFINFGDGVITRLYLKDTSLIVYDWKARNGYFFYEYGLNSKLNIAKYIQPGSGKGKALGSLSNGIYKNSLWMYDVSLNKIIFADLKPQSPALEYPFPKKYYNIQFLDRLKVIANGNYEMPKKIQEVDLYTGKITAAYGLMNAVPKNIPFYAWKRANEAFLALKPSLDKVVFAHRLSDQIEIFNLKTHGSITVKGPENYKVEFTPFKSVDDEDVIQRNDESRYAFTQAMATNKFIYLLYSGNNFSSPYIDYANTLYVYDWDGNPIKKINFDRYVSGFTVGEDNATLYAYDVISKFIVQTKINL